MRNPSDHSAYSMIIIINIYSDISEGGADNAQISASNMTVQSSDLHSRGEFSSKSFSTSYTASASATPLNPPQYSPPLRILLCIILLLLLPPPLSCSSLISSVFFSLLLVNIFFTLLSSISYLIFLFQTIEYSLSFFLFLDPLLEETHV